MNIEFIDGENGGRPDFSITNTKYSNSCPSFGTSSEAVYKPSNTIHSPASRATRPPLQDHEALKSSSPLTHLNIAFSLSVPLAATAQRQIEMAGRSFKPASYLASAAAPKSPRQRPAFTRTSSSSSVQSAKSEDSIVATLKGLLLMESSSSNSSSKDGKEDVSAGGPSVTQPQPPAIDDTPGRKRSQPIAIELPSRSVPKAYTPLSARGDLPGGYFPNHESPTPVHRTHPFSQSRTNYPDSPTMSSSSSFAASPASDTTPKMPSHILTPDILGPMSPTIPEPLLKPMGKYHPSNYKSPSTTRVSTPTSAPSPSACAMLPPTNLEIPTTVHKRQKKERPAQGHERKTSDVKRKLQQYQRDMIVQARMSAANSIAGVATEKKEPISPRLLPAGSPGPITPLELEMDGEEGYLVAGWRARGANLIGGGIERERGMETQGRRSPTAAV